MKHLDKGTFAAETHPWDSFERKVVAVQHLLDVCFEDGDTGFRRKMQECKS